MPDAAPNPGRDLVMSDTLPYEIWMMHQTVELLALGIFAPGPMQNALIESFAVHARTLIEFFKLKPNRQPDDADACDFTSPAYKRFSAGKVPQDIVDKINKQIAHITESRTVDPKEKLNGNGTDIVELRLLLDAEIGEFKNHITPTYQAIWNAGNLRGI